MRGFVRMSMLAGVLAMGTTGCAGVRQVRYVYQDGQSGVVGIPENTSHWPTYYRKHAEELMARHFPEGYEVIRAEEVVEGSRTLTINGSTSAELEPAGAATHLLSIGKFGRTASRSQSDSMKLKECRIIYKKAGAGIPPGRGEYADAREASWNPSPYIDPNTAERKGETRHEVAKPVPPAKDAKEGETPAGTEPKAAGVEHPQTPAGPGPPPAAREVLPLL